MGDYRAAVLRAVFDDTVRRANAYLAAGADCAFVPFVADGKLIGRLAAAIDGPMNVLAGSDTSSAPELQALGVERVSVGAGFAKAALTLVRKGAEELKSSGTYAGGNPPHSKQLIGFAAGGCSQFRNVFKTERPRPRFLASR